MVPEVTKIRKEDENGCKGRESLCNYSRKGKMKENNIKKRHIITRLAEEFI